MVYEQDAVQMIHFVEDGACQQTLGLELAFATLEIPVSDRDAGRACEAHEKSGKGETALLENRLIG